MSLQFPLLSTGSGLPAKAVSNEELVAMGVDTSDEWIRTRTGIEQRYICGEGETTLTLATAAARQALARAGVAPAEVGVVVVATCTPDLTFPSVASMVQGELGLSSACVAMDVNAACSGFIHALATARALLADGHGTYALVVGADVFSRVLDWEDRATCVLFGDGAGAVVMGCEPVVDKPRGLLGTELGVDGTQADCLKSSGGVATTQTAGVVLMEGREVFKQAVRQMGEVPPLLARLGMTVDDINWVVPHQANRRILEAAAKALGIPLEKVVITVNRHANTTAATIPLALNVAVADGRIRRGNILLLQAFGAGFVWSTAAVRW